MSKTLVQEQFGKTAASYLTSAPHAKGASLERLVALTSPQKSWHALDVATGDCKPAIKRDGIAGQMHPAVGGEPERRREQGE